MTSLTCGCLQEADGTILYRCMSHFREYMEQVIEEKLITPNNVLHASAGALAAQHAEIHSLHQTVVSLTDGIVSLRAAIEAAPHGEDCDLHEVPLGECDCWKWKALEGG